MLSSAQGGTMANESDAVGARWARHADGAAVTRRRPRGIRAVLGVPLAVVSTIAVTLGIAAPAEAAPQTVKRQAKPRAQSANAVRAASSPTVAAPQGEYVVVDGDTVSGVAERFGVATAEVLALNGLGWSSLIFPGQRLALPNGAPAAAPAPSPSQPEITKHVVATGETVSGIAAAYGLDVASVLSANGLGPSSLIFPGESIVLPLSGTAPASPAPGPEPVAQSAPTGESHVVVAGDTLSDIAGTYGVSVAELDAANGLGGSTVIVPGQVLVIRRATPVVAVASVNVPLTDEMQGNARIIIDVGRALGVPDHAIVIALAAAAQESGLQNLHHGDLDSLGLFQQRPTEGWGTVEEVLDPVRATTAFFGGAANPNAGRTSGLLDIPGWQAMTLTQAAQAVQLSAHPDHYAKWEVSARAWLSELG
jgi:LysM repeat protein